ncbi:MAG: hypothetical protein MK105_19190 [Crocinitomicaceae bacterium]|nr:hypothetical protein [Crocinitomicaceae bacterium]
MKKLRIIHVLLYIVCSISSFGQKYESTIDDLEYLNLIVYTDNPFGEEDYLKGDTGRFIKSYIKTKFDELIFYYDSTHKDTALYYRGGKNSNKLHKTWYRNGRIWQVHDVKNGINKAWYSDGTIRYDKVVNADVIAAEYSYNVKNKAWYPDGKLKYEVILLSEDSLVEIHYRPNGHYLNKNYYNYPGKLITRKIGNKRVECHHIQAIGYEFFNEKGILVHYDTRLSEVPSRICPYYYDNGQVSSCPEVYYMHAYYGEYNEYFEDGTIKTHGQYKSFDKKRIDKEWANKEKGGKGASSEYKVKMKRERSVEKFNDHKYYSHIQEFIKRHKYKHGTKVGTWFHYNSEGELLYKITYDENGYVINME